MNKTTILSKDIRLSEEKTKYDCAVKNLLADRMILAWILKTCAPEFSNAEIREIAFQYIIGTPQVSEVPLMPDETNAAPKISGIGVEDAALTEGTITFDIRFEAVVPRDRQTVSLIINLEAQNDFYPGYPLIKRGIYYCSRMISSQHGTVFTKSHYEKVKKVYSIWICMNPPKNRMNTITEYSVAEKNIVGNVKEKPEYYDLIAVVMICLGEPEKNDSGSLLKLLDVLLSTDIKAEGKQRILERDFDIPMTEKLERKVSEMCNLSEGVWEKGLMEGIEKGRKEGKREGKKEGSESTLTASIESLMKKLKMTAEQAMEALGIPEEEYEKYRKYIKN